jgi:hypothetical protein
MQTGQATPGKRGHIVNDRDTSRAWNKDSFLRAGALRFRLQEKSTNSQTLEPLLLVLYRAYRIICP